MVTHSSSSGEAHSTEFVLVSTRESTGVVELNRPRALNSLNGEMVEAIAAALRQWREDESITQVLITSTTSKAFCAGGDVRWAREGILAGEDERVDHFMAAEYDLDHMIATYPKPCIAVVEGITMGGGLGLFAHASHRVITSQAWASMPEMAIGYITDVGISYASTRWPGSSPAIGRFIGLSAYRMTAADMVYLGLATAVVAEPSAFIDQVIREGIAPALAACDIQSTLGQSPLAAMVPDIEATFHGHRWEEIDSALDKHPNSEFVDLCRKLMANASPSALIAACALFTANDQVSDLRAGLDNERRLGEILRRQPDFLEGVRAVLVDKDFNPSFTAPHPRSVYEAVLKS